MLPQVEEVLSDFPSIEIGKVNINEVTEIAGMLEVFTVPAVFVFVDGHEVFRAARFVPIEELRQRISKIYKLYNTQ